MTRSAAPSIKLAKFVSISVDVPSVFSSSMAGSMKVLRGGSDLILIPCGKVIVLFTLYHKTDYMSIYRIGNLILYNQIMLKINSL